MKFELSPEETQAVVEAGLRQLYPHLVGRDTQDIAFKYMSYKGWYLIFNKKESKPQLQYRDFVPLS